MDLPPPSLLDHSPAFFSSNGGNENPRKRAREAPSVAIGMPITSAQQKQQQHNLCFLQEPMAAPPPILSPAVTTQSAPPPVSTGLRLALHEQNQRQQSDPLLSAFFFEELAAHLVSQHKDEIEQFLLSQGEQLRRALSEKHGRNCGALLAAAEETIGRRLREKEAEAEGAARRRAELDDCLSRLRGESMAWKAKAMAEQATAACLHAQLRRATAALPAGEECCGELPAEDAGSAYVDPERSETAEWACRNCNRRPASVVLIPCRHLCLCPTCDSAGAGEGCPVCGCVRTGSVRVILS